MLVSTGIARPLHLSGDSSRWPAAPWAGNLSGALPEVNNQYPVLESRAIPPCYARVDPVALSERPPGHDIASAVCLLARMIGCGRGRFYRAEPNAPLIAVIQQLDSFRCSQRLVR